MTVKLRESSTMTRKGRIAEVTLINEGQGSSGLYEGAMLERYGPDAFPIGTHIYYNHLPDSDDLGGSHDVRDLIGVTIAEAAYSDTERALKTRVEFLPHAVDFIDAVKDYVGLSIEAGGHISNDGIVESLEYSPLNAVALVPRAGRGGKIQKFVESFRESGNIGNVKHVQESEREETGKAVAMTEEEITKVVEGLVAGLTPALNDLKEALAPKPVEVEETNGPSQADVTEALIAADLPKEARARVHEALQAGTSLDDAIKAEKTYVDSIREAVTASTENASVGFVRESRKTEDNDDFTGGW